MFNIRKKIAFLVVLAVFAFVVGMFGYKMGQDSRVPSPPPAPSTDLPLVPENQNVPPRHDGEPTADLKIVGDLKSTLKGITALKGDPTADETQAFLSRLAEAGAELDRLETEIGQNRDNERYKGQAERIISAIQKEKSILQDVQIVLQNPSDAGTPEVIKRVGDKTSILISETAGMKIDFHDLGYAFQLDDLASGLGVYLSRKHALDDAKRAEDERNAIRERENQRNQ